MGIRWSVREINGCEVHVAKAGECIVEVYWDAQDQHSAGWAWRTTDADGNEDGGPLDAEDLEAAKEEARSYLR